MSKKRYRPEEIIGKLREADVLISQGKKVADAFAEKHYYLWKFGRKR